MTQQEPSNTDARTKVVAAWAGVVLTAIAIGGFFAVPGARIVWIVLLVFGVATIPQVLLWRHSPPEQPVIVRRRRP